MKWNNCRPQTLFTFYIGGQISLTFDNSQQCLNTDYYKIYSPTFLNAKSIKQWRRQGDETGEGETG